MPIFYHIFLSSQIVIIQIGFHQKNVHGNITIGNMGDPLGLVDCGVWTVDCGFCGNPLYMRKDTKNGLPGNLYSHISFLQKQTKFVCFSNHVLTER